MKSLLDKTDELDRHIRQLRKMESKMRSGQVIDAWRDCNRIIADVEKARRDLIENNSNAE